ncbi:VapC toxin family PIN domain ribonuclease [Prauserella sp. PE36]|uniref:Ribonuclease VapC n=1 Tax=Prauserella endophytica TaxID=1592324 RepID=A0ABY2RWU3_9PSEU|nr:MULTISPECIES: PIN domain-containing protein [Prauserella]RBM16530.1 VapC toxin family PIN domain ribonuclease [Prauserella sp. PE36]TKG63786.1 type II toxin-antitoxin system VapC family toxin [Prauserella endophytica]
MRFVYLDSCAAIKLFKEEVESDRLSLWLAGQTPARQLTSYLTRTELRRGLHAIGAGSEMLQRAEQWLQRCAHVALPAAVYDQAGDLAPGARLRSLEALHLAAALSLGSALAYLVSYDKRLVAAAAEHGVPVASPE